MRTCPPVPHAGQDTTAVPLLHSVRLDLPTFEGTPLRASRRLGTPHQYNWGAPHSGRTTLPGYPRNRKSGEGAPLRASRRWGTPATVIRGAMRVIASGISFFATRAIGVHVVRSSPRGRSAGVDFVDGGSPGHPPQPGRGGRTGRPGRRRRRAFPPDGRADDPDELAGSGAPAWSLHDLNLADTLGMMRCAGPCRR